LDFAQTQNLCQRSGVLGIAHADLDQGAAVAKPAALLHEQITPRADKKVGADSLAGVGRWGLRGA
jgi:hypothetical protein